MVTVSRILPLLALSAWVALVPVLELEGAALELPVVVECTVSPAEWEACSTGSRACGEQMPKDCPVKIRCCVCLQFGGMSMNLGPSSALSTPMHSAPAVLLSAIDPQTRSSRPPVPPPQFG